MYNLGHLLWTVQAAPFTISSATLDLLGMSQYGIEAAAFACECQDAPSSEPCSMTIPKVPRVAFTLQLQFPASD